MTAAGIPIPNDTVPATVLQLLLDQQKNPGASINSPVPNAGSALPAPCLPPLSMQVQDESLYSVGPSSQLDNLPGAPESLSSGFSGSGSLSQSTTIGRPTPSSVSSFMSVSLTTFLTCEFSQVLAFTGTSVGGSSPPTSQPAPLNIPPSVDQSAPLQTQLIQPDLIYPVPSTPARRCPPFLAGTSESNNPFARSPSSALTVNCTCIHMNNMLIFSQNGANSFQESLIDPELLSLTNSTSVTPGGDDSPFPLSRNASRRRASEHSPIFGFVDGAGKGQKEWRSYRFSEHFG